MKDAALPQDLDAERALLGCLLIGCQNTDEIRSIVGSKYTFAVPQHATIYEIVCDILDAAKPVDLLVFTNWARANRYEHVDMLQQDAVELAQSFADLANAVHYARIVREHADRRELIRCGAELAKAAYDITIPPASLARAFVGKVAAVNTDGDRTLLRLADVEPRSLEWLWPRRIPVGKLTLLAGDPGLGKSLLSLDIAARVSTGTPWPDCQEQLNPAGDVILLSAEDDISDTVRPRLQVAEADCTRIHALTCPFTLGELDTLEAARKRLRALRLLVLDPLSAFLGGVDSHKNAETRAVLGPLCDWAASNGVAVLGVTHLSKSDGMKAMYRFSGSLAFIAAARAGWLVAPDPAKPDRKLLIPIKANLAPRVEGLSYTILATELPKLGWLPAIAWGAEPVTATADEILKLEAATRNRGPEPEARGRAEQWLAEALADGPVPCAAILSRAEREGIAERTLKRAKATLGVVTRRRGYGRNSEWWWAIECQDDPTTNNLAPLAS